MTYKIAPDGWVTGALPGPGGVLYPIEKHECPRPNGADGKPQPYRRIEKTPPDLLLHTTEGTDLDSAIATLKAKFSPSQWACGENRIAQLRPLWAQGAAVDTQSAYFMQVENVAKSQVTLWLPAAATLNPLVALVAMLHQEHIITTGTGRPKTLEQLPLVLDQLPAATASYYRRVLAPEPTMDGVRGHVDSKDDEHWDPGSFDYPTFFQLVEGVIGDGKTPGGDDMALLTDDDQNYLKGMMRRVNRLGPPTADAPAKLKEGFTEMDAILDAAMKSPPPGTTKDHKHVPGGVQGAG